MTKIIQHHPTSAVAFPRAIKPKEQREQSQTRLSFAESRMRKAIANQGVESINVPFEDFTLEVKDVESMGKVEIIHQVAQPKIALQVVHATDLQDFDKKLGNGLSMHFTIQYVKGDYTFMVIFSGIQGDFVKSDSDPHVRMHRVFDTVRAGAWWYSLYRDSNFNLISLHNK